MNTSITTKIATLLVIFISISGCSTTGQGSGKVATGVINDVLQVLSGKGDGRQIVRNGVELLANT